MRDRITEEEQNCFEMGRRGESNALVVREVIEKKLGLIKERDILPC